MGRRSRRPLTKVPEGKVEERKCPELLKVPRCNPKLTFQQFCYCVAVLAKLYYCLNYNVRPEDDQLWSVLSSLAIMAVPGTAAVIFCRKRNGRANAILGANFVVCVILGFLWLLTLFAENFYLADYKFQEDCPNTFSPSTVLQYGTISAVTFGFVLFMYSSQF
ncbi:uncharacterized protein LOC143451985 [Clavelina lepadiformis]|uniref:Uncharacterized protein n=1 Tax=Clavelina lepadiformis TaxID=159417 RepID=A0ABP0H083_CLALP